LQPLDVGIFGPLAQYYSDEVDTWSRAHPYQEISKGDFFPLCQRARRAALSEKNIRAAFAATGIYPFRRAQVMNLVEKVSITSQPSPIISNQQPPYAVPTNGREVTGLKRIVESSENLVEVKAGGVALAVAAGNAIAASAIANETIRQIASAPKKSKSDRRHISKALLISRSYLDKARKQRLEKDALMDARKKAREQRKKNIGIQSKCGTSKRTRKVRPLRKTNNYD
jgi:hypothetical protein